MRALVIIEAEVAVQAAPGFRSIPIGFQVDLLVFDCSPQPLDEKIVIVAAFPIHADPDVMFRQYLGESLCGKLAALIGIEYLRLASLESIFEDLDTEVCLKGVGEPPGEHAATVPVEDGHQVQKSPFHRDIRDVRRPDLVRPGDIHAAEQVGIDFVPRHRLTRPGPPVDGPQPHQAHQTPHPLAIDLISLVFEPDGHLARPVKRRQQILAVDQLHEVRAPHRAALSSGSRDPSG